MHQASILDGPSFDPFSFQQDGLAASVVDVGRGEIGDGLVVSQVIVVGDEGGDLGVEIALNVTSVRIYIPLAVRL